MWELGSLTLSVVEAIGGVVVGPDAVIAGVGGSVGFVVETIGGVVAVVVGAVAVTRGVGGSAGGGLPEVER